MVQTFYLSQPWDYYEALVWSADKLLISGNLSGFFINTSVFPSEDSLRIYLSLSVAVLKWGCFLLSEMHALVGNIESHPNQGCFVITWCMDSSTSESLPSKSFEQDRYACVNTTWTASGTHSYSTGVGSMNGAAQVPCLHKGYVLKELEKNHSICCDWLCGDLRVWSEWEVKTVMSIKKQELKSSVLSYCIFCIKLHSLVRESCEIRRPDLMG